MTAPSSLKSLPNPRRIATARAALTTAMAVRADCPVISDEAVIELLADLRHFCAGRNIEFYDRQKVRLCHAVALVLLAQGGRCAAAFRDFYACDDIAQEHFINEINGGAR